MSVRTEYLLRACQEAILKRDGRTALPLARRLVAEHQGHAHGYNLLGLAEHMSGNMAAAETAFRRALEIGGPDGGILSNLGLLYMGWREYAKAISSFGQAVSLLGRNAHGALFNMAQCELDMDHPEAAVEALEKAVALKPDYLKAWKELGLARRRIARRDGSLADIDAALACYDRIAAVDPAYPALEDAVKTVWRVRARIELDKGDSAAAVQSCTKSAKESGLSAGDFTVLTNATIPEAAAGHTTEFTDAAVLPGSKEWFVVDGTTLYADCMASTTPEVSPYLEACGKSRSVARLPETRFPVVDECFLLGGSDNYFHWLIDYLPRLSVYAGHERFDEIPLLTNADPAAFQRESLELLGIGEDRLIRVPEALTRPQIIRCRKLHAAPVQLDDLRMRPEALGWLRRTLAAASPRPAGGERVYVSRRDASARRVINEDAVAAFLRDRGFDIVVTGEMTLADQIAAFANAKIIVGAHGAGLANMVFAPSGARVIELMASTWLQRLFMPRLAESCGHRFHRVFCQPQATDGQREQLSDHDFDMFVSLDALSEALST